MPGRFIIVSLIFERWKDTTARDVAVTKNLKLKSWEAKKVKGILKIFHCNKPRCYFSQQQNAEYEGALETLWLKMESISFSYSCGDFFFDDDHLVSKVLGQRVSLTCESPVEKAYYTDKGRALKLPDICIHCAKGGSTDFLFGQEELEEHGKIGGRQC